MNTHPPGVLLEIAHKDGALFSNSSKGDICIHGNTLNQSMHFGSTTDLPPAFTISGPHMIVNATLGVGSGEPVAAFNVQSGDAFFSSNVYVMNSLGLGTTEPTEALDIQNGNVKMNSNLIVYGGVSVAKGPSQPTESLDIGSNLKVASNAYIMSKAGIGTSNPTDSLSVIGNTYVSSNSYVMNRLSVGKSNPTETLDVASNALVRSNAYVQSRMSIGASTLPSETLDVFGNAKVSGFLYSINNVSIGTSNAATNGNNRFDVTGDSKFRGRVLVHSNANPTSTPSPQEMLDVHGNARITSNLSVLSNVSIMGALTTSRVDVSSNLVITHRFGAGTTTPSEQIDVASNILARSNVYALGSIGAGTSLPRESVDATGNIRALSNVYAVHRLAVGHSNPSEQIDITQNIKARTNAYVMSRLAVGTSNPAVPFHVIGNARIEGNLEVYGQINAAGGNVGGGGSTSNVVEGTYGSNTSTWASNTADWASNELLSKSGGTVSGALIVSGGVATGRVIVTRANSSLVLGSNAWSSGTNSGGGEWASNLAVIASNTAHWSSNNLVNKDGDTMTGALTINGSMTAQKVLIPGAPTLIGAGWDYSNGDWVADNANGGYVFRNNSQGGLEIYTGASNTLNMNATITSNGLMGLATYSPQERLDVVDGNIKSSSNIYAMQNIGIGTTAPEYSLHVMGTIYGAQDILAYSDLRAKSNLEVISNPIERLSGLTGYTYDFLTHSNSKTKLSNRFTGIIAQDLEKVLPEAVHKDDNGNLSVAYGNMAGLFVESIKQLVKQNEELTKANQLLEARVTTLESRLMI